MSVFYSNSNIIERTRRIWGYEKSLLYANSGHVSHRTLRRHVSYNMPKEKHHYPKILTFQYIIVQNIRTQVSQVLVWAVGGPCHPLAYITGPIQGVDICIVLSRGPRINIQTTRRSLESRCQYVPAYNRIWNANIMYHFLLGGLPMYPVRLKKIYGFAPPLVTYPAGCQTRENENFVLFGLDRQQLPYKLQYQRLSWRGFTQH